MKLNFYANDTENKIIEKNKDNNLFLASLQITCFILKKHNDKHLWIGLNKNNVNHKWQDLEGNFCDQTIIDWYPGESKNYHNGEN